MKSEKFEANIIKDIEVERPMLEMLSKTVHATNQSQIKLGKNGILFQ
jgi:hypothetical protein